MKDPWSPFVKDTSKIQITETRWSFGFSGHAKCKARATCLISQSCWIYYDGLCNSPRWWIIYVLDYYFSFGVYFCWGFGREKKRKRELPPVARTTDLLLASCYCVWIEPTYPLFASRVPIFLLLFAPSEAKQWTTLHASASASFFFDLWRSTFGIFGGYGS